MSAQALRFTIAGDFMADFARTRVLERRWDAAVKLLQDLQGITMDQIVSILKGEQTLNGDSNVGIGMEPWGDCDAKAQYLYDLAYIFTGCYVDSEGRFLRPYAIVTSWGPEDYDYGARVTKGSDSALDRRGNERAGCSLFYANDPARDVLRHCRYDAAPMTTGRHKDGTSDVLFEEVRGFPTILMDASRLNDAQSALDAFIDAGHTLREVGYVQLFPPVGVYAMPLRHDVDDPTEQRPSGNLTGDPEAMRELGRARLIKIDAEKSGVSIEEMTEYRDRISDKGIQRQLDAIGEAQKLQDNFGVKEVEYKRRIAEQAGDNWLDLVIKCDKYEPDPDRIVRIPQAPFEHWCLWRGDGAHLALPWKPVCPSGLKMFGDDPYHSDFLVGSGLGLDAMRDYDSPVSKAVYDLRREVQKQKLGFKVAVLCGSGTSASLKVVHPKRDQECKPDEVAVIPNAGPHYVAAAMTAGAIICEQGGAMAHLVTVSREKDVKIVRIEKAREIYPVGMHLVVDCAKGDVRVPYNRIDHKMKIMGQVIDVDELP